ncbi:MULTISPECIES: hypothetical protein [Streptomyces]|uniref:Uncharacterized protein n=1 Tax=Streptomyces stelliscabiei TaxID=146820 RepID=A0A8I0PAZ8_9ACTN|nr:MULTISPECIES: hypothetical protein [Streptomyces]MBE1599399.1 hypothetical protein [Streptomyces stelliscabiei]MDX2554022.1 hypothetical protein [Streptomyces stelliscabiei]MDX2612765.1 hypothetical protein [Streptomyces stelliscabiei]MDX2638191.1 hypothetical protein [Streptomyces stelliscabiei]MDX2666055.1 hypothetical protein [Streptomyces stelliscabiei]
MVKVRLETSREHVAELARLRDPIGAVEELIWNSVDADAGHVVVRSSQCSATCSRSATAKGPHPSTS